MYIVIHLKRLSAELKIPLKNNLLTIAYRYEKIPSPEIQ